MSERRFRNRIREEIQRHLAEIVEFETRDPVLRGAFPTVMDVKLSPDGHYAKVYIALGGEVEDAEAVLEAFNRDRGFFRSALAERLDVRYTPDLRFVLDDAVDRAMRWRRLLGDDAPAS